MGFETEKFVSTVDDELICPICDLVLENPLQIVECQHVFCSDCITKWIQTGNQTCPLDRKIIQKEQLKTPRLVIKFLEKLQIKCDFTSQGCDSIVKLEHLSQHCKQCKFNPNNKTKCPKCGMSVEKKESNNHDCDDYDEELNLALEMSKVTFEEEKKRNSKLKENKHFCSPVVWNQAPHGSLPVDLPFIAGHNVDGEKIYIGRVNFSNDVIPGKVICSHGVCYFSHGKKEHERHNYQVLTNPLGCDLVWIRSSFGQVPFGAVQVGKQSDGELLYVGRVSYKNSLTIGKVVPKDKALYIPFKGGEISINQYEILACNDVKKVCPPSPLWIHAHGGSLPDSSPMIGGHDDDGEAIYVGRAIQSGNVIPGKVIRSHGFCYISHGGKEHKHHDYQVLTNPHRCNFKWISASNGHVPSGAVEAGRQTDGKPLYVGRAKYKRSLITGKVDPSHGVVYIAFDGNEIAIKDYEVLCIDVK